MAINQHPFHSSLLLLKSEILIFEGEENEANLLLDVIEDMEPSNEEVYIQKDHTVEAKKSSSSNRVFV